MRSPSDGEAPTPTSLRTIHGADFSVSASGTDAGSTGPNGETLSLIENCLSLSDRVQTTSAGAAVKMYTSD